MTFFYDLNKKMAELSQPVEQLNERSEKWIQKAVDPKHKGDLHKALHVPQGEKIPKSKIEKATHSKDAHLRHMAQFAKNVAKEDAVEEGGDGGQRQFADDESAGLVHRDVPDPDEHHLTVGSQP